MIAEVPEASAADVDRAVAAAKQALAETWLDTTPGEREPSSAEARRPDRGARRRARARSSRRTSASRSRSRATRCRSSPTTCASSPAGARILEGRAAGEYMRGYTSMHPARAARRRRPDRALELPADDGGLEARPGARRRQHRGAQAVRADAADAAPLRRAGRPTSSRPACSTSSPATASRPARRSSRHPGRRAWSRSPATSQTGKMIARDRRRHAQARPPRARRQGAGGRLRRRRPRRRSPRGSRSRGYCNSGQDCTAASRVLAGPEGLRQAARASSSPAVESLKVGDPPTTRPRWAR